MMRLLAMITTSLVVSAQLANGAQRTTATADDGGSLVLSLAGVVNDRVKEVRQDQGDNEMNLGAGVLVEANINDMFGIETGALLVNRQYEVEKIGIRVVQEVRRLQVPVMARFWATDYFSVAAGPSVAFKVGDKNTSLEIGDVDIGSLNTSADDDVEFGLDAAATLNLAFSDKTGVFVEGRYTKVLDQESEEDLNEFTGLAGVRIDI